MTSTCSHFATALVLAALPLSILPVGAQSVVPSTAEAPTDDVVTATFVDDAPRIDGVLDDEVWQGIVPITNLTQIWPDDGAPATEPSEVRIAYDRDNLYFAFRFRDSEPHLIRAKNLERGGRNDRDDHAYISLDTYLDGRDAYLFEMNALGTQDDATITDEGLTIDSFSWDAVFRSETVIDDEGWTMEVAIPFRQLRFPKADELEFGLLISRMINRKNERANWPYIGLEYGSSFSAIAAVSQYGTLRGLKNIRRGKNIEIKPYVIAGAQKIREDLALEDTDSDFTRDLGVDIKYGMTSNLTLDLSVNTDFAQVESDNVQLNLSRFSLFFPEKREFFLERSGLFEHGNPGSTQTFFSRRIGLADNILTGARLTGQVGDVSVGVINIETGQDFGDLFGSASSNNLVARTRANVFPRATVGAIFTNLKRAGQTNRAFGADAQYRFWSSSAFETWYSRVDDTDPLFDDGAGHASLRLQNDTYAGGATFTSVGANYMPALGFVRRRDMRRYQGHLAYHPRVAVAAVPNIRRVSVETDYEYIEGQDGALQSTALGGQFGVDFNARDHIAITYAREFERLEEPFFIRSNAEIPADDYTFTTLRLSGETDSSRRLYGSARVSTGGFFSGDRTDIGGMLGFRQSQYLQLEGSLSHSMIDLPVANGEFDATTMSLSILGAANRKLFARALLQYDNFSRDLAANIRIDWIHTPGSDLFLVFNTSYHVAGDDEDLFDPRRELLLNDRVGVVKLTYLMLL
jgi:hypothetical protein